MYLLIALVLQATAPDAAAQPQPPATQAAPASTQQAAAPANQAAAAPRTEVRCRWHTPTGARIRQRICETVETIEGRQESSEAAANDFTRNRGVSQ